MKTYNLPSRVKTLIFDIDGTLYQSQEFVDEQIDVQIRHWAKVTGVSDDEARKKIADYRKEYFNQNNRAVSLGNTFLHFGIDIDTSIEWRNTLLEPEKFLSKDIELIDALTELKESYHLVCVTNNPVAAARKTLSVVGIADLIPDIVGLDTLKKSKPAKEILDCACEITGSSYNECVNIGDRFDIDIALGLELGMGGILVNGAREVCQIKNVLG